VLSHPAKDRRFGAIEPFNPACSNDLRSHFTQSGVLWKPTGTAAGRTRPTAAPIGTGTVHSPTTTLAERARERRTLFRSGSGLPLAAAARDRSLANRRHALVLSHWKQPTNG
jgi:hypothetical protein